MYRNKNKPKEEQTADPSKYPQKNFRLKKCRKCSTEFKPLAPSEHYCSDPCKDEATIDGYLRRTYGLVYADYLKMLEAQDNRCKICGGSGWCMAEHHKVKLVVDHDHKTGKVRGLLCHNCNRGLGLMGDSKTILLSAIKYLERCNDYPERE